MKKIIPFVVLLLTMANNAFADPCVKSGTIKVPVTDSPDDQKSDLPTPCPGETLTVEVDVPVKKDADHTVSFSPTTITDYTYVQKGSNLALRGGVSTGITFPGHPSTSFVGGLVGEVGYKDSMWRLQVAIGAGTFQGSSHHTDGVAVNSGLAVMASVAKHLRIGPAVDLLYGSDIASHPEEMANERLVGTSFRAELHQGYFSVTATVGAGVDTMSIPGGRKTNTVPYAGLSFTLWTSK